jgi:Ca2+-binding RTX toxin-like protein
MRARYADIDSVDAIDGVESEENLLVGRTSTLAEAEYTAPTAETALDPSNDALSSPEISDTDSLAGGLYEAEGELEGFGIIIATLNDYTYGELLSAEEVAASETVYGISATISILNANTYDGPLLAEENPNTKTQYGTIANDYIFGEHLIRDIIFGRGGDDYLWGGDELGPGDRIEGGTGNDIIFGGFGEDYLRGDEGDDVVDGGASNDTIYGNEGNDVLRGGHGNDRLSGMTGADELHGEEGNDYLDLGDYGDDDAGGVAFGGAGNDHIKSGRATGSSAWRATTFCTAATVKTSSTLPSIVTTSAAASPSAMPATTR